MVRSMMCQTELPLYFWGHALQTAAHTLNIVPSKSVEKTPHELWMGKPPNISFLKIWGCEAYVKRMMSTKLEPKADKCFFIGYPRETKGYSFWHKSTNTIFVKKGAIFLEKEFLERIKSDGSRIRLEETQVDLQATDHEMNDDIQDDHEMPHEAPLISGSTNSQTSQRFVEGTQNSPRNVRSSRAEPELIPQEIVEDDQEAQEDVQQHMGLRRSTRERRRPDFYMGLHEILVVDTEDPLTYEEAIERKDSKSWQEAMESEIQSMHENQVWNLVNLPEGKKAIRNK
jgi:hypothetical protein